MHPILVKLLAVIGVQVVEEVVDAVKDAMDDSAYEDREGVSVSHGRRPKRDDVEAYNKLSAEPPNDCSDS